MSDAADAAGDDSGQGADLVFRSGAAANRRADEGVARPLVAAEKEKVADDLPNQGSFQSLSSEREGEREIREDGGGAKGKQDTERKVRNGEIEEMKFECVCVE